MSGPLAGMRVLDLSQQLPGPYATLLLAALGAEVTKVEPPTGDAARHLDPDMFDRVNAGKASVVLDLKTEADRDRLHALVAEHDVFVEGFRPGVAARLGCDYPTLRCLNESLVYCSISGFGQTGPLARTPSHDLSLQALVGALPPQESDRIGVPWVDLGVGTTAALAVVAHWHAGTGAHLDLAMLDVARAWSSVKPEAVSAAEPTYGVLGTRDGRLVTVALLEDAMWRRLCRALDWADWEQDAGLATYAQRRGEAVRVRQRLAASLAERDLATVLELASRHDLPMTAVGVGADPVAAEQLDTRLPPGARPWQRAVPLPTDGLDDLTAAPRLGGAHP